MGSEVRISVLMSVYNPENEAYLRQAVMSIVNQSFSDWEMILYDDGSEEAYRSVISEMASVDSRIRCLRGETNMGLAGALNYCLPLAKGKYIARMDADDISKPDRLEKMYRFLEENPEYDWVGSNAELVKGMDVWGFREMPQAPQKEDFLRYSPYIHPSVVFRRQVLVENGGYGTYRRGEDYELFMRLTAAGKQGFNLQEILFQYREDADTYRRRKYKYQIEEVGIRKKGFRQLGILDGAAWLYIIKPLVVGLIPNRLQLRLKVLVRKDIHVEGFDRDKEKTVSEVPLAESGREPIVYLGAARRSKT